MNSKKVLFTATVVKTHINAFHLPFLKMFKDAGWEVHVAAKNDFINEPCVIPNCDKHYDIDFDRFPFSRKNFYAYRKLKNVILENQYDIVHCHTPVAGVLTRLAARYSKNTTVIYTAHGFHFFKGAPLINWLMYYPIERLFANFTDKLITINNEDYEVAKNWSLRKNGNVYLVNGVGIDVHKFKNINFDIDLKKSELGVPKDYKVILSVGELIKRKNHEIIIRALNKIADKKIIYLICGRGTLQNDLQKLIESLNLTNRVKLLGFRNDVAELYKIVDLFVFPSLQEGLPVALMEAMASGAICIASDIRGNRDLLNNKMLCTDINNVQAWADKINTALQKGEFETIEMDSYDINIIREKMRKIYGLE